MSSKAAVPTHAQRMTFLLRADKFTAVCRSQKGGVYIMGGEVRAGGRRERGYEAAATACTGPDSRLGARARAERTQNMQYMFVTLEVSKNNARLKAVANCRVEGRAHAMRGGRGASREAGRPWVLAAHKRYYARGRPNSRLGGQRHARSAPGTCRTCL